RPKHRLSCRLRWLPRNRYRRPRNRPTTPSARSRSRCSIAPRSRSATAGSPGDNALELVLDAEKLEPTSPRGKALRAQAIETLLASADQLWTAGKQDSARTLYADALLFDPTIDRAKTRAKWK